MITKTKSTHALTAQAIRKELKLHFPLIEFRIRADSFAGGNSVDISWSNGPTDDQVTDITSKYQYGHFDGMRDLYEHSNIRKDIPQVKYVQTRREITNDIMDIAFQNGKIYFGEWEGLQDLDHQFRDASGRLRDARTEIWRILSRHDLSNGYNKEMLVSN